MKLQNAKGVRDYLPEEMIALNKIIADLKESFEAAGFNPITTPVIERMDVLAAKYAGGAEILKETFSFKDQGERELGLRYDLTVPFARIIGQNPQLKLPFKRYQMEKVYRDGPVGTGRYREFWQCDIDMVGPKSMKAEVELLSIVESFFKKYNLKPIININNRKILDALFKSFAIKNPQRAMLTIDKWKKVKKEDLIKELIKNGEDEKTSNEIISYFNDLFGNEENNTNKDLEKLKETIAEDDQEGINEIQELLALCKASNLDCIKYNGLLARGLSYYTGTMIEVTLEDNNITSTVCAGGRYDSMIGNLLESKEQYPAVGLSFGLSRIFDALLADNKIETKKTVSKVFVYTIGSGEKETNKALEIAARLRAQKINTEIDLMQRKPNKNIKYVESLRIPFAIALGENEVEKGIISLRTKEGFKEMTFEEAIEIIKG